MIETTAKSRVNGKRRPDDFPVMFLKRIPVRFALEEDQR